MTVRAKFAVYSVEPDYDGSESRRIKMGAVYSADGNSENARFWRATPSGILEMQVVKPETAALFEVGKEYYVDFTKAE